MTVIRQRPGRGGHPRWAALAAGGRTLIVASVTAALLAAAAQALGHVAGGDVRMWAVTLGWTLAGLSALAGSAAAVARVTRGTAVRRAWALYAAGSGFWIAGSVIRLAAGGTSLNQAAAACWLGFALCGVASFSARLPRSPLFAIFLLDALPVVLLLIAVMRQVVPVPAEISTSHAAFLALYPALYGLLAAHAIQMAGIHRDLRRLPAPVVLFTAGFALMLVAALVWVPAVVRSGSVQGHPADALWTAGLILLAGAGVVRALNPGGYVTLPSVETQTGPHALPPAGAMLGLIALLIVAPAPERLPLDVFLLIAAVDLFARVLLIRREDLRLVGELVRSRTAAESAAARERRGAQRLLALADATAGMKSLLADELLRSVCDVGRDLVGAGCAVLALAPVNGGPFSRFAASGLTEPARALLTGAADGARLLDDLGTGRRWRLRGHPAAMLAPQGQAAEGFLGVPIAVGAGERAGLFLVGKAGGFGDEDEVLAKLLAVNAEHAIANAGLYAEATAQREQLAMQNSRLRELDRMKEEFVALISHELRTPLTSIIGYLELVADEDAGPLTPRQHEFASVIDRNAKRLRRLVDDLLLLSRIQSGELAMEAGEVDLARLAALGAEEVRPAAERRGVAMVTEAVPVPGFTGDRVRLAQLLTNLLTNAVKFCEAGDQVTVSVRPGDGGALLEVADTGMGIPRGDQQHVFERFFRAGNASRGAIPGTGLGLTVTKAIVDAHGGAITVASEVGRGTTFQISLPLRPGRAPEAGPPPDPHARPDGACALPALVLIATVTHHAVCPGGDGG